jgi:periplasmic mercuric ion binding protein
MKMTVLSLAAVLALAVSARAADSTVKLSEVHICCNSCVTAANKLVATVPGVKGEVDKDAGTITLTAANKADLQKTTDALVAAGFYGKSSDASVKVNAETGAKGEKVKTLTISGVHLCCSSCVTAVGKAVKSVDGVESHTAARNAKTFEVKGDFNDKAVLDALQKAGLTGKVAK